MTRKGGRVEVVCSNRDSASRSVHDRGHLSVNAPTELANVHEFGAAHRCPLRLEDILHWIGQVSRFSKPLQDLTESPLLHLGAHVIAIREVAMVDSWPVRPIWSTATFGTSFVPRATICPSSLAMAAPTWREVLNNKKSSSLSVKHAVLHPSRRVKWVAEETLREASEGGPQAVRVTRINEDVGEREGVADLLTEWLRCVALVTRNELFGLGTSRVGWQSWYLTAQCPTSGDRSLPPEESVQRPPQGRRHRCPEAWRPLQVA